MKGTKLQSCFLRNSRSWKNHLAGSTHWDTSGRFIIKEE